jgi:glycosyltransferase involved in cell wall biosynthesis
MTLQQENISAKVEANAPAWQFPTRNAPEINALVSDELPNRILTLFLSAGKSLKWWQAQGIFSREILIYRRLLEMGEFDLIQVFSYDAADHEILDELTTKDRIFKRFQILAPRDGLAGKAWGIVGVLVHRAVIAKSAAIKTNQISGAWAATLAARLTGVPLVLRAGYMQSRNLRLAGSPVKAIAAAIVERAGSRVARRIIVTSEEAADYFRADPKVAPKVRLLPNYVDVDAFAVKHDYDWEAPIISVARLSQPKNLPNLLRACKLIGARLTLIGVGEKEAELRSLAATLSIPVHFMGKIDNAALPGILSKHTIFVIPSFYEGMPKALIEAMSVGLITVGSDISGIRDLIEDGTTGYLAAGTEPQDIATALGRAFQDRDVNMGSRARAKVEAMFGLNQYAANEAKIFREVAPILTSRPGNR